MQFQQTRLLRLKKDVPTLGEFSSMPVNEKIKWLEENPAEAAALNISVIPARKFTRRDGSEGEHPAQLEWKGLSKTVWSKGLNATNKEASFLAFWLRELVAPSVLQKAREIEQKKAAGERLDYIPGADVQAARIWLQHAEMPLNHFKFIVVNKAREGLAKYYSKDAILARMDRAMHQREMRENPAYAFYVSRALGRGEMDALNAENIPTE